MYFIPGGELKNMGLTNTQLLGFIIDLAISLAVFGAIGFGIGSIKLFRKKRKLIIVMALFLGFLGSFSNLMVNMRDIDNLETLGGSVEQEEVASLETEQEIESTEAKFSLEEVENLFNMVVQESEGGILDISYTQQGYTIEVDVQLLQDGWELLDDNSKHDLVFGIGKGAELAIKQSELFTSEENVYVYFYGKTSSDELANYSGGEINIVH
jgi:hypothetical protein